MAQTTREVLDELERASGQYGPEAQAAMLMAVGRVRGALDVEDRVLQTAVLNGIDAGWQHGHDEACRMQEFCSAHQSIVAKARGIEHRVNYVILKARRDLGLD